MQLFGTKGQKFLHYPVTTGQAQNLATGRDRQDNLSKSRTGGGMGQSLFFCQNAGQGWDMTIAIFFPMISCFRMSFSCFKTSLSCFLFIGGKLIVSQDVPGQRSLSRDFRSCPCPGTKKQQEVPSLIVRGNPIPNTILLRVLQRGLLNCDTSIYFLNDTKKFILIHQGDWKM